MRKIASILMLSASFACAAVVQAGQSNPVNLGSGVAMYDVPLFSIPQAPLSLDFRLHYHSQDARRPTLIYLPMGLGWTHSFNETLVPTDGSATVLYRITAEGWEDEYMTDGAGHWLASSPAEIRGTVTLASNEYTITDLNGQKTVFDAQTGSQTFGRWKRTVDRWGNAITGAYSGADLISITDSVNRVLTLSYTSGKLTQILLPGNDTWRLQYTNGLLSGVFDPIHSGTTAWRTFSYQNNSLSVLRLLTSANDEANKSLQSFSYDSTDRPVSASSEGGTDSMTIQYGVPTASQTRVTRAQSGTVSLVTDYALVYQGSRWLVTKAEGGCTSCGVSGADTVVYQYFPDNHLQTRILGLDLTGSGGTDERAETDFTYDANGMMTSRTEAVGKTEQRVTSFAYGQTGPTPPAWPAFVTAVTEVSVNSAHSKTTTNAWNGTETQLTTTMTGYLSPTAGASTAFTTVTNFDSSHRPTATSGPRPSQLTSLAYYVNNDATLNRRGRLQGQTVTVSVSPSSNLATSFDNYDLYGTARSVIDPNLVETQRTTDSRGRVLTVVEKKPSGDANEPPDYTTTYSFDTRDRLTQIQRPLGNLVRYAYEDGTNRLVDTIRAGSSGLEYERLHLTLNLLGGKRREDAQTCATPANPCTTWSTASRTESFVYDGRNRLSEIDHPVPAGSKILYTYDSRGNQTKIQDERHSAPNTLYAYDFRDRLKTITQKRTIVAGTDVVTNYAYDQRDDLTSVTDPNGNITTYTFDDWARMTTQASPVSGTTSYIYDEAGNLTSSTDANSATTTKTYDLANRLTLAQSSRFGLPDEMVVYTYDDATAGAYRKGRIATMVDNAGTTTYAYERRGLPRQEAQSRIAGDFTTIYVNDANGNRSSMTYPSGRVVAFTFDFADRAATAVASAPTPRTYVSSASYQPFGPLSSVVFGNGTTQTLSFDTRYRPTENKLVKNSPLTTFADVSYTLDSLGNITGLADNQSAAYNRSFGYDDLNRLTAANAGASLWGTASGNGYTYDAMGNMLSLTLGTAHTATFSYSGTTSKLTSVTENGSASSVTYDAAGNETSYGVTPAYSARNFLASFGNTGTLQASYTIFFYDGRGVRIGVTRHTYVSDFVILNATTGSVYTPELNLIHQNYTCSGGGGGEDVDCEGNATVRDFIWFAGRPVAQEEDDTTPDGTTHSVAWTVADHLGTPIIQTDSTPAVSWRMEYEPFGPVSVARAGDPSTQPLRFPGQEDTPYGTYNIFRWYRSNWGRYTQPDPVGLSSAGSLAALTALFSYGKESPIRFIDPRGLVPTEGCTKDETKAIDDAVAEASRRLPSCAPCAQRPSPGGWINAMTFTTFHCATPIEAKQGANVLGGSKCGWNTDTGVWTKTLTDVTLVDPLNRSGKCPCLPSLILEEVGHNMGFHHEGGGSRDLDRMCFPECKRWQGM